MIPEVPKTWIYIYHVAQGKFIKEVFYTKAVPFGISYRNAWRNLYRKLISNVIIDFYIVGDFLSFPCLCVNVLYFIWNRVMLAMYYVRISASHIYLYPALVFISSFVWSRFIYDLYLCVYICVNFCMYILFCNRVPWKNSLTEWSTLVHERYKLSDIYSLWLRCLRFV